jgi:hypothetical protein
MNKHADPQKSDLAAFRVLDKIPNRGRGSGGVICLHDQLITLQGEDRVIPVNFL